MARRPMFEDVAQVNGFTIERERRGAAVVWNATAIDLEGYQVAGYRERGSKAEAILCAETHEWPKPDRWIGERIAVFEDRERAQAFADLAKRFGQPQAHVGSLSGLLMTSDNSPSVWIGTARQPLEEAGILREE